MLYFVAPAQNAFPFLFVYSTCGEGGGYGFRCLDFVRAACCPPCRVNVKGGEVKRSRHEWRNNPKKVIKLAGEEPNLRNTTLLAKVSTILLTVTETACTAEFQAGDGGSETDESLTRHMRGSTTRSGRSVVATGDAVADATAATACTEGVLTAKSQPVSLPILSAVQRA